MSYNAARPSAPSSPVAVQLIVADWNVVAPPDTFTTAVGAFLSLLVGAPASALEMLSRPLVSVGLALLLPMWPIGSTLLRIRCLTCAADSIGNADHTSAAA